uniref:Uridine diphosphate glucose pyrophosphatase NUDT14 n=1 Tax=Panagrolaimus superbus TaxID=310955 RepID=A0A914YBV7_9BILA
MEETITNVKFDETLTSSPFLKPIRLHFERRGRQLFWDLALEHDSVSCVLFHHDKNALLFVKQFRPPSFVRKVRGLPENVGKTIHEIDWSKYPVSLGETIELCAGLMDKPNKNPLQTIREEIIEECGFNVAEENIKLIKRYISSISVSGSHQNLFYAEVDNSMKISEGGGNASEGEFISKIYMSIEEAKDYLEKEIVNSPPGFLFAVKWFLDQHELKLLPTKRS